MNYTTLLFAALIGALLGYTGLGLGRAILLNYRKAAEVRQQLAQRIVLLPLSRMLDRLGINTEEYLSRFPLSEVETSIRACESCAQSETCQGLLKDKNRSDFAHCPNNALFGKFTETCRF